jgi:hypothetical protein
MDSFSLLSNLKPYFEESEQFFNTSVTQFGIGQSSSPSDCGRRPCRMKPHAGDDREQNEQHQNDQLSELERLLGLRRFRKRQRLTAQRIVSFFERR